MSEKAAVGSRIYELDLLRGISVFLMIFDHMMFDLWGLLPSVFRDYPGYEGAWREIYLAAREYWTWDLRIAVRYIVVFIFLSLTGICCSFSKSNIGRGAKLGAVALALSAVTFLIGYITGDYDIAILFGVLHCIALTLVAVGVLERFTKNKWVYLIIGVAMIAAGLYIGLDPPYVRIESENILRLLFETVVGASMSGGDSFPPLFNGGQIFVGVFLGKLLYSERKSLFSAKYRTGIITFFGRHSLPVYIAHQAALPLILAAMLLVCGFSLG